MISIVADSTVVYKVRIFSMISEHQVINIRTEFKLRLKFYRLFYSSFGPVTIKIIAQTI